MKFVTLITLLLPLTAVAQSQSSLSTDIAQAGGVSCPSESARNLWLDHWDCRNSPQECYEKLQIFKAQFESRRDCVARGLGKTFVSGETIFSLPAAKPDFFLITVPGLYQNSLQFRVTEFNDVAEAMGFGLINLTLPGHGMDLASARNIKYTDWTREVDTAINMARSTGAKVILMGQSTGGALALAATLKRPDDILLGVFIEPALRVRGIIDFAACTFKNVIPTVASIPGVSMFGVDPITARSTDLNMGCEVNKIGDAMTDDVLGSNTSGGSRARRDTAYRTLRRPVVIINNEHDSVVNPAENKRFADIVGSGLATYMAGASASHGGNDGFSLNDFSMDRVPPQSGAVDFEKKRDLQTYFKSMPVGGKVVFGKLVSMGYGDYMQRRLSLRISETLSDYRKETVKNLISEIDSTQLKLRKLPQSFDATFSEQAGFRPDLISKWLNEYSSSNEYKLFGEVEQNLTNLFSRCKELDIPACRATTEVSDSKALKILSQIAYTVRDESTCVAPMRTLALFRLSQRPWRSYADYRADALVNGAAAWGKTDKCIGADSGFWDMSYSVEEELSKVRANRSEILAGYQRQSQILVRLRRLLLKDN